ncbi:MAG: hypothetical protein KDA96_19040 [Planctomycetaceae bacterium]|nr:hypothetical protein [Planctomycetaceae bacterium]
MADASTSPSRERWTSPDAGCERLLILLAVAVITAATLTATPLQSANDRSRWATVWSLVERGTYQIDEIDRIPGWSTIDKVRHRSSPDQPWHFYSSKPPLLSTLVAGLYFIERQTLGHGLRTATPFVTRLLLLLINVVPMALALISLSRSMRLLRLSSWTRCFVLASAGLGTMVNPFLTTLNNHTPAAVCLLFSLAAILRIGVRARPADAAHPRVRSMDFALLGFFAALTACFELPAALFGLVSFGFAVLSDRRKTLLAYVPSAMVPLAAFFVTNWICTGGIKPFYAYYGTEKYEYIHNGIPSYWMNPQGMDALQESTPVYAMHCLIGHHGLFSLTPVLLLSVAGWMLTLRRDALLGLLPEPAANAGHRSQTDNQAAKALRVILTGGALLAAATLSFYLTRTKNYNYGGNTVALRWMLWLTPFFWYALIPVMQWIEQRSIIWRWLSATLLLASVISVSVSMTHPWKAPWLFDVMQNAGWIDYRQPPETFASPRRGLLWKAPSPDLISSAENPDTFPIAWRSSDGRRVVLSFEERAPGRLQLTYTETTVVDSGTLLSIQGTVDVEKLIAGDDVSQWLTVEASTDALSKQRLQEFLRGVPGPAEYQRTGMVWLRSGTRPDAIAGHRGATKVTFHDLSFGDCEMRCDAWFADDFFPGSVRWKQTVTQKQTGQTIRVTTWTAEQF